MYLTQLFFILLDSIVVLVWLDSIGFFLNSIWLTPSLFIFGLSHTVQITFKSGFREYHIGQGVSEIFQLWNRGILHNSVIEIGFV